MLALDDLDRALIGVLRLDGRARLIRETEGVSSSEVSILLSSV